MKYQSIPGTELHPSVICLGTVPLGSTVGEEDSFALLDAYVGHGGNFIDTANVYADWLPVGKSSSERMIGKWLKARGCRDKIILATKGAHPELATMHIPRMSRQDIVHDIEQSLGHLQTDYIDLYWLHRDDPARPAAEIIEVLNEQIRAGKIRHIGCSNWTVKRLVEANRYAADKGLHGFVGNQMMWSLAAPNEANIGDKTMLSMHEEDISYHERTRLAAIPFSSQAKGLFSGRYNADNMAANKSVYNHYYNEVNLQRLDRVRKVAEALSRTQTEIALGYLISHDFPVFPIIGSHTLQQLAESCLAGDIRLGRDVVEYLRTGRGWVAG